MLEAYKKFWQNYVNFSDRSRRSDYWYVVLINMVISIALSILAKGLPIVSAVSSLYSLATLVPGIAIVVRRLHDIGKSGWHYLFVLIPIVGAIILIVWLATDSQPGENIYGPNPKEVVDEEIPVEEESETSL